MKTTNVQINYKDTAGSKGVLNIGYANPNATDGQLADLAHSLMSITSNSFVDATRVDRILLNPLKQAE